MTVEGICSIIGTFFGCLFAYRFACAAFGLGAGVKIDLEFTGKVEKTDAEEGL